MLKKITKKQFFKKYLSLTICKIFNRGIAEWNDEIPDDFPPTSREHC